MKIMFNALDIVLFVIDNIIYFRNIKIEKCVLDAKSNLKIHRWYNLWIEEEWWPTLKTLNSWQARAIPKVSYIIDYIQV